jgi:two-component sensor histidine kinase
MYFLKAKEIKVLNTFYKIFITIAFLEMIILSQSQFYNLNIVVFTALLNMAFNLAAGFISYMHGNKQARLYILGFSIVSVAYILIALSTLGIINAIHEFRYLLLALSTLEALILSLAFTDSYLLLQKDKEKSDALLLKASKYRTKIIEKEVTIKTQELKSMVETQKLLIQEIHHRVKNNLQIILSMLRMQNDHIETELDKTQFQNLENRINAIAKTYDMLIINEDLEEINLSEYIDSLLSDIQSSYSNEELEVTIKTDISSILPLRASIYIGLILNEMVTNTYKYAFDSHGTIEITLHKHQNEYILTYRDDGKGFLLGSKDGSLGLKLINQLVYHQLNGSMEVDTYKHTKYTIRFTL